MADSRPPLYYRDELVWTQWKLGGQNRTSLHWSNPVGPSPSPRLVEGSAGSISSERAGRGRRGKQRVKTATHWNRARLSGRSHRVERDLSHGARDAEEDLEGLSVNFGYIEGAIIEDAIRLGGRRFMDSFLA
jgi:hypothetical protein